MTTTKTPIRTATLADELVAGRPFPVRDVFATTPAAFRAFARARREFWVAAADGYLEQAERGCPESARDAADALAQADRYAALRLLARADSAVYLTKENQ